MLSLRENTHHLERLNDIGIALAAEHDMDRLLEMILDKAKLISNADAGMLFIMEDGQLTPKVIKCDRLNIHLGGMTGKAIHTRPIDLHDKQGKEDHSSITAHVALTEQSVNIADIYDETYDQYDFTATKRFDQKYGYRTQSVLAVPLINKRKHVLGVIRLSNAQNAEGNSIPFDEDIEHFVESLAGQAAVAYDNDRLLIGLEELLESIVKMTVYAIGKKSPHTGKHCEKVPLIGQMIVDAACDANSGPFKDFTLSTDERYAFSLGAWLHDCGKLTTPDHILEKSTKLETIHDRIALIEMRYEVLLRDQEIAYLKDAISQEQYEAEVQTLKNEIAFLQKLNQGAEWVSDADIATLHDIAKRRFHSLLSDTELSLLTEDELHNLSVRAGTLTAEERRIIMDHIVVTIEMLDQLPFPRELKNVPEYAGTHHEKMDGSGYPKGLHAEDLSIPARAMVIADIFEALTSADRPYKKPKTLTEACDILYDWANNGKLDKDLLDLMLRSDVLTDYAQTHMLPEQRDSAFNVQKYIP